MKKKLLLSFPKNLSGSPITYNLIKKYDMKINILRADIDFNAKGTLLLDIEGENTNIELAISYLKDTGINVQVLDHAILIKEEECVQCGACTAVCTVNALEMNEEWKLLFNGEKCLDCKLCIKACPARVITSVY